MKKKYLALAVALLASLLFTGCAMRTVEDMYALPKRSEIDSRFQSAIDMAMVGLSYSAPLSGENQQTVQTADLDGDGVDEYLIFAKGNSENPLHVLIFRQLEDGGCVLEEVIQSDGTAFEQVEYVQFDDTPGCEIVVGRRLSEQVLRSVSVYSFTQEGAQLQLLNGYSKFLTCDLDENGRRELMVFRPGEAENDRGMAVLYAFNEGHIQRSVETGLSSDTSDIRRITIGRLQDGTPAVYVASSVDESAIVTDIFALKEGRLTNVSFSGTAETSISTLRNYYVYAEDIDEDGILELPSIISMKPVVLWQNEDQRSLLRWFSVDVDGWEFDKMYTYHNFVGGWYLHLGGDWATRVSVVQSDNTYTFYVWDEEMRHPSPVFSVYALTGSLRDTEATDHGRFALYRAEGVVYAARLEESADLYGITQEDLLGSFRLIYQDWQTGEN